MGKTRRRGKATKLMALAEGCGLPLAAAHAASAWPHQVTTLVEATLEASFLGEEPECLLGDRAYHNSEPLDAAYQERGMEMIAPHRILCPNSTKCGSLTELDRWTRQSKPKGYFAVYAKSRQYWRAAR